MTAPSDRPLPELYNEARGAYIAPLALRMDDHEDEDGLMRFVASTDAVDRYGTIVDQDSWRLDNFRKNPVFLWMHGRWSPPVGRVESVEVIDGRLIADVRFDDAEDNPMGRLVARQYREGTLNAVSVSWVSDQIVRRSELPEDHKHYGEHGYVFRGNELHELSAVTVPGNADALAIRSALGDPLAALEARLAALESRLAADPDTSSTADPFADFFGFPNPTD